MRLGYILFIFYLILQVHEVSLIYYNKTFSFKINIIKVLLTLLCAILIFATIENPKMVNNLYFNLFFIIYSIVGMIVYLKCYFKNKSNSSVLYIKKAIDESKNGVMVLDEDKIIFENNTMYNLLEKLDINNNFINNIIKHQKDIFKDGYIINIDNLDYLFIINENNIFAYDVNDEYKYTKLLEKQNLKLENANKEISHIITNIEKIRTSLQSNELKIKYHDILGQNLTLLHHYLNNKNKIFNLEKIKFMIRKMLVDIKEESEINLNDLIEIYKNIDVFITLNGKLPKEKIISKIFLEIIRESITNAVRHADSKNIEINIKDFITHVEMEIINDGFISKDEIIEHSGLIGMREKVKKLNGIIKISKTDKFKIFVSIKKTTILK